MNTSVYTQEGDSPHVDEAIWHRPVWRLAIGGAIAGKMLAAVGAFGIPGAGWLGLVLAVSASFASTHRTRASREQGLAAALSAALVYAALTVAHYAMSYWLQDVMPAGAEYWWSVFYTALTWSGVLFPLAALAGVKARPNGPSASSRACPEAFAAVGLAAVLWACVPVLVWFAENHDPDEVAPFLSALRLLALMLLLVGIVRLSRDA